MDLAVRPINEKFAFDQNFLEKTLPFHPVSENSGILSDLLLGTACRALREQPKIVDNRTFHALGWSFLMVVNHAQETTAANDIMSYDVVTVGAGPAGLAFAIRLKQLSPQTSICVLEKGATIGAHILSGAVVEPEPFSRLLPDWQSLLGSECLPVHDDQLYYLSQRRAWPLPTIGPATNQGHWIISLGALCRHLANYADSLGVDIFPGFAASRVLQADDGRVTGVQTGAMGVDRDGHAGPNYSPGVNIHARCTVLAEGARGHLTQDLLRYFRLTATCMPQTYSIGIKERWQLQPGLGRPGRVMHTLGWPATGRQFGGGFLYDLHHDQVAIGYISSLNYRNPNFRPWDALQSWKSHPSIAPRLEGGTVLSAGARAIVTGGWQALPQLEMPGALLIGDTAGLLNFAKIKGVHQAVRSGELAAEHLQQSQLTTVGFSAKLRRSPIGRELQQVRNIKPGFHFGTWLGLVNAAWETLTCGHSPWTLRLRQDDSAMARRNNQPIGKSSERYPFPPYDRLQALSFAEIKQTENQPIHLLIQDPSLCVDRCFHEYGNPCTRFCPANVYEMREDPSSPSGRKLQINAANCLHCKTCDIKDPYQLIRWVPSEGGSGPNYHNL